jgi:hypothetical protein
MAMVEVWEIYPHSRNSGDTDGTWTEECPGSMTQCPASCFASTECPECGKEITIYSAGEFPV